MLMLVYLHLRSSTAEAFVSTTIQPLNKLVFAKPIRRCFNFAAFPSQWPPPVFASFSVRGDDDNLFISVLFRLGIVLIPSLRSVAVVLFILSLQTADRETYLLQLSI